MKQPRPSAALVKAKAGSPTAKSVPEINRLYKRVCEILEASRQRVARTVNTEMVQAYWLIGQAIVEQEQKGRTRAGYGEQLIEGISERLRADGQKGFDKTNLWVSCAIPALSRRTASRIVVDALSLALESRER